MTPFHDLGEYMALPRTLALRPSPDGKRLITVVQALAPDRKTYRTALWELEDGTSRRLTRSAQGEGNPVFRPDGSLLFTSGRPDPTAAEPGEDTTRLWALPSGHGEPRVVAEWPGGIGDVQVARDTGTIVFAAATLPGAADAHKERRDRREAAGVTAILHDDLPIRSWDHQLGPEERRLYLAADDGPPRDLTPAPGHALTDQAFAITPDGRTVVTGWWVFQARGECHCELIAIDTATGEHRRLAADDGADFSAPAIAPDGNSLVCVRESHAGHDDPVDVTLWHIDLRTGHGRDLTPGLDLWPGSPVWSPDSATVHFSADERGRRPIFHVPADGGQVTRLTSDDAAYYDVTAVGETLYALRSAIDAPPTPVRVDATGTPHPLTTDRLEIPGHVTEVTTTAADGTPLRAWLVVPENTPAPLLLWPHGGPNASWNAWTWRWNAWIMAARGYAVLLPDPALSTGYGQDMIRRAHGAWGPVTYDDLMAITDAALARDDIDETRTAVMGGSFGGYMANWIAGQTDRFDAIVTHASLWPLDTMVTSDEAQYLVREFGEPTENPDRWTANDPARHAGKIRTPMLVIHGDRDYRVPINHALQLWWDLLRNEVDAKFLYYPDENHWIMTPGNATVWYETVLAFLAQHVLGEDWARPDLL